MKSKIAILFPGQGSQFIGMGKELYDNFATAREVFEEVDAILQQNLSKLIFDGDAAELTLTSNAQPAIMAVSVAVWRVLLQQMHLKNAQDIGIVAAGHSLGEYSALCVAGVISLADTARLLRLRGNAMQDSVSLGSGAMLALLGTELENAIKIAELAAKNCSTVCEVANDNGAGQVVLSGETKAIDYAALIAADNGAKKAIKLQVSAPFHSSMIQSAATVMQQALEQTHYGKFSIPVVANYTAVATTDCAQVPDLLTKQITGRVRWRESIQYIAEKFNCDTYLEIGPGKVLTGLNKKMYPDYKALSLHSVEEIENVAAMLLNC